MRSIPPENVEVAAEEEMIVPKRSIEKSVAPVEEAKTKKSPIWSLVEEAKIKVPSVEVA